MTGYQKIAGFRSQDGTSFPVIINVILSIRLHIS